MNQVYMSPVKREALDEQYQQNRREEIPDRVEDIVAITGEEVPTREAKALTQEEMRGAWDQLLLSGQTYNLSAQELNDRATSLAIKQREFNENPRYSIEQSIASVQESFDEVDSRFAHNIRRAQERVGELRDQTLEQSDSTGRYVGDFVDRFLLRQTPIGAIEDLTARRTRKGYEILNNAASMPPQEFEEWFSEYAQEVREEGVLTDDNIFAIMQLGEEVSNAGFDPNKGIDQLLAIFDIPGVFAGATALKGLKAARKLVTAQKSSTAIGRVGSLNGEEAAAGAGENILKREADPQALADVGNSTHNPLPQPVKPSSGRYAQTFSKNKLVQAIQKIYDKGGFGRIVSRETIEQEAQRIADKRAEKVTNVVYDQKLLDDGLGTFRSVVWFGKAKTGEPYVPIRTDDGGFKPGGFLEQRAADIGPNASVVPLDSNDLSKGYLIQVEDRIDTVGLSPRTDPALALQEGIVRSTVGRLFNNPLVGSAAIRDNPRLSALSQLGEAGEAAIRKAARPFERTLKGLNQKSQFTLNAVYGELRDGYDADLRVRYTDQEFRDQWIAKHPEGTPPTERDLEAYHALATLEEADYVLKTTRILQDFVSKGYSQSVHMGGGVHKPAKAVRKVDVPEDQQIMNLRTRESFTRGRWGDELTDEQTVFKLDSSTPEEILYVFKPDNVRVIGPEDVMGYNPGSSRVNPYARYFITIGKPGGRLRAILTAPSEQAAMRAKEQIGRIEEAIRRGDEDLDSVVQRNNEWNPSVDSAEAWHRWVETEGWPIRAGLGLERESSIGVKARDSDLLTTDLDNSDLFGNSTVGDFVQNELRRGDRVLPDFGGGRAYNQDPVTSVFAQLGSSSHAYAHRAYTRNAMVGWVKDAQSRGRSWFPDNVSANNWETLFREANVQGDDAYARRMRELRNITLRRLNQGDEATRRLESMGKVLEETVFNRLGKRVNLPDPVNGMLKIGFQSVFGFFNASQLFMQGFHAVTIAGISPRFGSRGAAMATVGRGLLRAPDSATYELGKQRFARAFGMDESEVEELLEFTRTSGRDVVEGDAIEDGTGVGWGVSGWGGEDLKYSNRTAHLNRLRNLGSKGLDAGLYFFKTGERLGRMTGINTAFLEFKAKFPGQSALTDFGRDWITRREQALTFHMTTGSRAMVQSSLMKVPTQWFTFTLRSMEQVFVGKELTKGERARLAGMLFPFYGLAGFGLENAAGYVSEQMGVEPDSNLYIGLRSGLLDYLSAEILGAEDAVAVGERMAPIGAIMDTYEKIERNELSALTGPSGEIVSGIASSVLGAVGHAINGRETLFTEDLLKVVRQPTGLDAPLKAWGMYKYGIYKSKNDVVVPGEMSTTNAVATLLGFSPQKVALWYGLKGQMFNTDRQLADVRRDLNRRAEEAFRLLQSPKEDDIQRGAEILEELNDLVNIQGFSENDRQSLRRSVAQRMGSEYTKVMERLLEFNKYEAQQLERVLQGVDPFEPESSR